MPATPFADALRELGLQQTIGQVPPGPAEAPAPPAPATLTPEQQAQLMQVAQAALPPWWMQPAAVGWGELPGAPGGAGGGGSGGSGSGGGDSAR